MPIIRRVIKFGRTSRGIILPKSWLKFYEDKKGFRIDSVAIEVNGVLKIEPILLKKTTT